MLGQKSRGLQEPREISSKNCSYAFLSHASKSPQDFPDLSPNYSISPYKEASPPGGKGGPGESPLAVQPLEMRNHEESVLDCPPLPQVQHLPTLFILTSCESDIVLDLGQDRE